MVQEKTEAIEYLESNGAVLGNHVYYCSNANKKFQFAVDVHRNIADEESWTLVVNDVVKRVLYVMNIPAIMLAGTNIMDDHDKYTLRFNASQLYYIQNQFFFTELHCSETEVLI